MSFETMIEHILDATGVILATLMFFWFTSVNRKEEGNYNLATDIFIMLISKTSPFISIPISVIKLWVGVKDMDEKMLSPVKHKENLISLLWWSLGIELVGLINSLFDLIG